MRPCTLIWLRVLTGAMAGSWLSHSHLQTCAYFILLFERHGIFRGLCLICSFRLLYSVHTSTYNNIKPDRTDLSSNMRHGQNSLAHFVLFTERFQTMRHVFQKSEISVVENTSNISSAHVHTYLISTTQIDCQVLSTWLSLSSSLHHIKPRPTCVVWNETRPICCPFSQLASTD